jgi:hypothetical protein
VFIPVPPLFVIAAAPAALLLAVLVVALLVAGAGALAVYSVLGIAVGCGLTVLSR